MPKSCRDLIPERTVDPEVFADMDNFDLVNNPTAFAKSLRLQFPKFSKGFSSSDFEEFVQEHVGVENLKSLGRLNFPNEWQMEVESKDVREKLIRWGKTKIKNRSCWISPLCTSEIRGFVHWLPNIIPNAKVKELLSDYGEVLFVENQKQTLWSGKVASDSRYFALYLRAGKSKEDLPHFAKIENFHVLVTVRGRNPACFHCRESGHRKNECKKYKERINNFCQRPPKSGGIRFKPRGKRYSSSIKDSQDTVEIPDIQNDTDAAAITETKQKATENKDYIDKKQKKITLANSEVLAVTEELNTETKQKATDNKDYIDKKQKKITLANSELLAITEELKLKVEKLFSETVIILENKLAKMRISQENVIPPETGGKKKKKKKKNKKKTEAKSEQEDSKVEQGESEVEQEEYKVQSVS